MRSKRAIYRLEAFKNWFKKDSEQYIAIEKAIEALQHVESIVRCKDCKYRDTIPEFSDVLLEGCRWANEESPDDDDFCSYGERKEE